MRAAIQYLKLRKGDPNPDRMLGGEAKLSLLIHFFFQFGASMSGVFLNLYLWRLTEDLWINGMYNVITFIVSTGAFFVAGWIAKKKDRMYTYRLGLLLIALFYIGVVFAQEKVAAWYILFAIFNGLSTACYWVGYLVLMFDVSNERNRIYYLAMNSMVFTLAGLAGPALAGWVIATNEGLQGYIIVFGVAFVMFMIAAFSSLKISTNPSRHKTYYIGYTWRMMKREPGWFKALWSFLCIGLLQGIMLFLPNILLFQVIPREDWIGYMSVLFSLITIGMSLLMSRFARSERTVLYMWISGAGMIMAASLLLFGLSLWTVVVFMILYSLFNPLQGNTITSHYYYLVSRLPLKGNFRVESVVLRELFLNTGRIISILALISLLSGFEGRQLAYILLGGALCQLLLPLLTRETARPQRRRNNSGKSKAV